jgi:hypothetical protein
MVEQTITFVWCHYDYTSIYIWTYIYVQKLYNTVVYTIELNANTIISFQIKLNIHYSHE